MISERKTAVQPVGVTRRAICTECDWVYGGGVPTGAAITHVAHFGHDVVVLEMTTSFVTLVPEPEKAKS